MRSWNRIYAQAGDCDVDDNPDTKDYLGHGEWLIDYNHRQQSFGLGVS